MADESFNRKVFCVSRARTKEAHALPVYIYDPSKAAAIVFAVLFALSAVAHVFQIRKHKSWKITGPLPWGGTLYVAGFVMREISARNPHNLGLFIAGQVLLLAAPPVYSLTNYMLLGRTLYYVPYLSMIHPGRVISTFLGLDVIVEILTGNGAAKIANVSNTPEQINIGKGLIRASLLLQIVLLAFFISLEVLFHLRLVRAKIMTAKLRTIVVLLYTSSALILVRNIYRCIEVWQGYEGYLQRHEAFFYVFDAGLMLVNTIMLNVWHPARFLPTSNKVYLAKDGITELEGPGWVDPRPWWATALDPFDLVGLFKGKDKKTAFWENEDCLLRERRGADGECGGG